MDVSFGYHLVALITIILSYFQGSLCETTETEIRKLKKCSDLLMGQYICNEPEIDIDTQQASGCNETRLVRVSCKPAPNITCIPDKLISEKELTFDGEKTGFYRDVPCKWTSGYRFETALLLSVFLGMFGIDRFYLGYPAIGLLKFSTLGFFFLGQLIDVLLIATQVVSPSDGSDYVLNYFGAGLVRLYMNNDTVIKFNEDSYVH